MDEKELLRIQIKSYEFYAGLIDRAVGGGTQAKLPRWDEQRAAEYHALAEQLRRRLADLEAQEPQAPEPVAQAPAGQAPVEATLTPSDSLVSDEAQSIMVDSDPVPRS